MYNIVMNNKSMLNEQITVKDTIVGNKQMDKAGSGLCSVQNIHVVQSGQIKNCKSMKKQVQVFHVFRYLKWGKGGWLG